MNRLLCLCGQMLLGVCCVSSFAQEAVQHKYSFVVTNATDGSAIGSATCRVLKSSGGIRAYGITNADGCVAVSAADNDSVVFSCIGFGRQSYVARSLSWEEVTNIRLSEQDVTIREIAIKAPPIRSHGDTIVYNVRSFLGGEDSHLEDVLKKMPGITITGNGSVLYQGKPINKFYIEGKDLLGSSYNQATRNMPVDAVAAVEILENHQPSKILRGRSHSDKAALNVRLNDSRKSVPFGEGEGGVGLPAALWSGRLFLTHVGDHNQYLVTARGNNTGADLSQETVEHIDVGDLDALAPALTKVLTVYDHPESMPLERYVLNKSLASGGNHLVGLADDATLRTNILFFADRSKHDSYVDYVYGGDSPVGVSEGSMFDRKIMRFMPSVKYEKNSSEVFVSNEFKYLLSSDDVPNRYVTNDIARQESAKCRQQYFNNYFATFFFLNETMVKAKSLIRVSGQDEKLGCESVGSDNAPIAQKLATKSVFAKHILSFSRRILGNPFSVEFNVSSYRNAYRTDNSLKHVRHDMVVAPHYEVAFGSDSYISLGLPLGHIMSSMSVVDARRGKFYISPSLFLRHQFNDKWRALLSASATTSDATMGFHATDTIYVNYRTQVVPFNKISLSRSRNVMAKVSYADLVSLFFAHISLSCSKTTNEKYSHAEYDASRIRTSTMSGDNKSRYINVEIGVDKRFPDSKVMVKALADYSSTSYLLSQSDLLLENSSNVATSDLHISFNKLYWLKFDLGAKGALYWQENDYYRSSVMKSLDSNASLFLFVGERSRSELKYNHYVTELSHSVFKRYGLLDANVSYKISDRCEATLSVSNVLDTKSYSVKNDTGINTSTSMLPLRGREMLVTFKFGI